ncbi:MAG: response regulator transcription factor [Lactobacillus crispatus]|jgi:DNA-binding response OmpR family regulator|uniref:response regulator transcription factor n=1 Tax=Lactobacillus crispatus TaxID=47770 RepID=UPI0018A8D4AE|nr:response regulator transcription factor [Lactobacillus crispatus]MCH4004307.1 response regulator transcription factor [Lactobacillus crispatus]MCI1335155.1 response regulator transcription factor [Lactobacillus crispatus]MCI1364569.1 response regulator transcription factor [Lactobacillus crispatus]MCI1493440.1 response regulator transcription factor [Lactobacillus crispatus]MCI1523617.1 response regulator transcription factor [Lactobacillus crispatus]
MKILVAEDEPQLLRVLTVAMEHAGYDVDPVDNGLKAVEHAKENSYDVIMLDIMMPVMDGITALKKIRESGDKTYILMLTAKAEVDDRVTGLDSGADDYLTKPFSLKELLARLRSKERREDDFTPNKLELGDVTLNVSKQELVSHNSIRLSGTETQLMNYFLLNQNKELSTEELLNHVWKNDADANADVVWIYVSYLRQKLQSIQSSVRIEGDKGGSYKLVK